MPTIVPSGASSITWAPPELLNTDVMPFVPYDGSRPPDAATVVAVSVSTSSPIPRRTIDPIAAPLRSWRTVTSNRRHGRVKEKMPRQQGRSGHELVGADVATRAGRSRIAVEVLRRNTRAGARVDEGRRTGECGADQLRVDAHVGAEVVQDAARNLVGRSDVRIAHVRHGVLADIEVRARIRRDEGVAPQDRVGDVGGGLVEDDRAFPLLAALGAPLVGGHRRVYQLRHA